MLPMEMDGFPIISHLRHLQGGVQIKDDVFEGVSMAVFHFHPAFAFQLPAPRRHGQNMCRDIGVPLAGIPVEYGDILIPGLQPVVIVVNVKSARCQCDEEEHSSQRMHDGSFPRFMR